MYFYKYDTFLLILHILVQNYPNEEIVKHNTFLWNITYISGYNLVRRRVNYQNNEIRCILFHRVMFHEYYIFLWVPYTFLWIFHIFTSMIHFYWYYIFIQVWYIFMDIIYFYEYDTFFMNIAILWVLHIFMNIAFPWVWHTFMNITFYEYSYIFRSIIHFMNIPYFCKHGTFLSILYIYFEMLYL